MHMWYHLLVVLCFVAVFYIAQLSSDVHNDLSWYFCQSWGTRWLVWRTVCRSQKFSLEPQESTNPSKLSGIPKPKPAALSWLKRGKKSARKPKGTFLFTFIFMGETWFYFDSFTNQDSKFIDTWSELHKYQKPSHQSRTASPEGAGLLCPCQASTQGELDHTRI